MAAIVLAALLAMHFLPKLTVCGTELRQVNMLSDLIPSADDTTSVVVRPTAETLLANDTRYKDFEPYRPKGVTLIDDYSNDGVGGMNHFYSQLLNRQQLDRPVRIAYFCDSFTEGDILTCDLRQMLQDRYGGTGIGWVDCTKGTNGFRPTIELNSVGFTEFIFKSDGFNKDLQGINQRYFLAGREASVTLNATTYRKGTSTWQNAYFYFFAPTGVNIAAYANGEQNETEAFAEAKGVQQMTVSGNMTSCGFKIVGGGVGARYYGVALESNKGVILDNLNLRGTMGWSLNDVPFDTFKGFAEKRPYDLIIVHYGVNAASDQADKLHYNNYISRMKRVIAKLRAAYPEASILVMSVGDRDQRTANGIETVKAVEHLSAYQNQMAADCKVAYFNLFKAMGGRNSMKTLVDKGMANKDYTHLKFDGGKFLADKMMQAILAGEENYKRKVKAGIIK